MFNTSGFTIVIVSTFRDDIHRSLQKQKLSFCTKYPIVLVLSTNSLPTLVFHPINCDSDLPDLTPCPHIVVRGTSSPCRRTLTIRSDCTGLCKPVRSCSNTRCRDRRLFVSTPDVAVDLLFPWFRFLDVTKRCSCRVNTGGNYRWPLKVGRKPFYPCPHPFCLLGPNTYPITLCLTSSFTPV